MYSTIDFVNREIVSWRLMRNSPTTHVLDLFEYKFHVHLPHPVSTVKPVLTNPDMLTLTLIEIPLLISPNRNAPWWPKIYSNKILV